MDRLVRILRRRRSLLLLGLALAGLWWLRFGPGGLSPDTRRPPGETAVAPAVLALNSSAQAPAVGESAPPALLRATDRARRLSPLGNSAPTVLSTAFPGEDRPISRTVGDSGISLRILPCDAFPKRFIHAPTSAEPDTRPQVAPRDPAGESGPSCAPRLAADGRAPQTPSNSPESLLLPHGRSTRRSEQLERIARQADRQIRHGFGLASRGACFAARSEFIQALRLIAQGLDSEHRTPAHSRALAAALTAVNEAEDFIPDGSRLEGDLHLGEIIASHRTPVLKDAQTEDLTSMLAVKCYLTFAQEQLGTAAGHEVAGSMALHALGKLYAAFAARDTNDIRAAEPKAIVFYQAALLVFPHNHLAANDLGVLLARGGNYPAAEAILKHSLSIHGQSTGWHNLAVVYWYLGRPRLTERAAELSAAARRAETAGRSASAAASNQLVRWVDPKSFAQTDRKSQFSPRPTSSPQTTPARPKPAEQSAIQPASTLRKLAAEWLPRTPQEKKKEVTLP